MDAKLELYRAKKRRKEFFDKIKQRLISMVTFAPATNPKKDDSTIEIPDEQLSNEEEVLIAGNEQQQQAHSDDLSSEDGDASEQSEHEIDDAQREESKYKYFIYLIWFCFWATCWMIAIELKFGIVYLLFSALFFIYFNTRTGPKRKNEVSAYSVFNKDCQSIKGTLTGEQLAGEMIYGPFAAMRTN